MWHATAAGIFGFVVLAIGIWVLLFDGVVSATGVLFLLTGIALVLVAVAIEAALGHGKR